MLSKSEQQMVSVCVDLLEQNSKVHILSMMTTVVAVVVVMVFGYTYVNSLSLLMLALAIILLGVVETVMVVRVSFDAALLRHLTDADINSGLTQLDEALVKLKLMPQHKTGRELDVRLQACIKLFKTQIVVCGCQIIGVICFGVVCYLNSHSVT